MLQELHSAPGCHQVTAHPSAQTSLGIGARGDILQGAVLTGSFTLLLPRERASLSISALLTFWTEPVCAVELPWTLWGV